ncbi:Rieske (2Fe-2S) protein [Mycolicibacterium sediminis]|uniref:Cytochrome bc1 complex Rieske iron-sulfur subunit n=1 Tax=Mycolicibacterium sediminis TaxID=1286180 RepID=A0A7I7QW61_9MYCO|nr:Rieske (2Fe-2S) protein [Mycolicibacterium sediminis]BBY30227.1 hypothetical protein MSEDJ_43230 [Mycolicibacterium sediminis]
MPLNDLHPPRRAVLAGAALGVVATAAACSGAGDGAAPSATSSADGAPATLAATADVPVGSGVIVDDVVVTQPTAGVFKGFSAVCPHAGCNVSEVDDANIVCRCHGSRFDLEGAVVKGPATKPLEAKAVVVRGESIVAG